MLRRLTILVTLGVLAALGVPRLSPPAAHAATPPNIVVVMTDDQPADGSISKMPFLRSLQMQWFANTYDQNAVCCAARWQWFTGESTYRTGVENVYGPDSGVRAVDSADLWTWAKTAGYTTGFFGKWLNSYGKTFHTDGVLPPGIDVGRLFYGAPGYGVGKSGYTLTDGTTRTYYAPTTDGRNYSTDVLGAAATAYVDSVAASSQPFLVEFAPYAPHLPHLPAPVYLGRYATEPINQDAAFQEVDVSDKPVYIQDRPRNTDDFFNTERRRKWETLLSVDDQLRALYDAVVAAGKLNNTVFVFTSDNGFADGEHRWRHKKCEYDACNRIPLGVLVPGQPASWHPGLVQLTDLTATVNELMGALPTVPQDGQSFLSTLYGGPEPVRTEAEIHWIGDGAVKGSNPPGFRGLVTAPGWTGPSGTIYDHAFKYVELSAYTDAQGRSASGERELYDKTADPSELQNLHGDGTYAAAEADLAARLAVVDAGRPPVQHLSRYGGEDD